MKFHLGLIGLVWVRFVCSTVSLGRFDDDDDDAHDGDDDDGEATAFVGRE